MNNKVLAVFGGAPLWIMVMYGFFGELMGATTEPSDGFYTLLVIWMLVFSTWACVRLFRS